MRPCWGNRVQSGPEPSEYHQLFTRGTRDHKRRSKFSWCTQKILNQTVGFISLQYASRPGGGATMASPVCQRGLEQRQKYTMWHVETRWFNVEVKMNQSFYNKIHKVCLAAPPPPTQHHIQHNSLKVCQQPTAQSSSQTSIHYSSHPTSSTHHHSLPPLVIRRPISIFNSRAFISTRKYQTY